MTNAELYDPATGSWSATGDMNVARSGQTGTLLPDGQVLVAGTFSVKVTIPQATTGSHKVSALGWRSFAGAGATFTVTG